MRDEKGRFLALTSPYTGCLLAIWISEAKKGASKVDEESISTIVVMGSDSVETASFVDFEVVEVFSMFFSSSFLGNHSLWVVNRSSPMLAQHDTFFGFWFLFFF